MYSWTLVASEVLKAWCEVYYLFEFCLLRPLLDNEGKINWILDIILSIFDWRGLTHWYLQHWVSATIIEKRGAPTSDFGYVRLQFYYSNTWWLYDLRFKKKWKQLSLVVDQITYLKVEQVMGIIQYIHLKGAIQFSRTRQYVLKRVDQVKMYKSLDPSK